ncbi:hypothetical protein ACQ4PT_070753 [Festuca glaucescens]
MATPDTRWHVTYAITLRRRELVFSDGFLIVRHDAGRFVLLDDKEVVIDARSIREGESAESGGFVEFPCHLARIPLHPVGSSGEETRGGDPEGGDALRSTHANQDKGGADSGLDGGARVAAHQGPHGGEVRQRSTLSPISGFDLDSLLSHLWRIPRVSEPTNSPSESFEWWLGKVAGDHRSFAQVVASPPRSKNNIPQSIPSRSMGDRGGRAMGNQRGGGGGGRGNTGRFDRQQQNRNLVWQRDVPENSRSMGGGSETRSRWEAVAAKEKQSAGGRRPEGQARSPTAVNPPRQKTGCLGDYFYDFYYEVESVVVRGPPATKISISTSERSSPNAPSPKRSRIDHHKAAESSEGQTGASQNVTYGKSYSNNLDVVPKNDYEEDSEEDHELLIDTIAREQMEKNQQQDGDIVRVCDDAIVEESSPVCKEPCNVATDTVLDLQQKATVIEAVPNVNDTSALLKAPATPVVSKEIVCLGYHQNTYERSYASVCILCSLLKRNPGENPLSRRWTIMMKSWRMGGDL